MRFIAAILLLFLVFVAASARAESDAERSARKAFDIVLLRPLGFAQTLVSGVFLDIGDHLVVQQEGRVEGEDRDRQS